MTLYIPVNIWTVLITLTVVFFLWTFIRDPHRGDYGFDFVPFVCFILLVGLWVGACVSRVMR